MKIPETYRSVHYTRKVNIESFDPVVIDETRYVTHDDRTFTEGESITHYYYEIDSQSIYSLSFELYLQNRGNTLLEVLRKRKIFPKHMRP